MVSGLPKTVVLTSEEIRPALEEPLSQIIDAVKETLDRTPPELASDIMDRGHHARGRRLAAAGPRRAPARGDADARPPGRVAPDVRRGGLRPVARGVRGHPPPNKNSTATAGATRRPRSAPALGPTRVRQDGSPPPGSAGAARRRLPDPAHRLLRRVGGGGLHAVQRGVLEVVSPDPGRAPAGAQAGRATSSGWFGDTLDAKGERDKLQSERDALRKRVVGADAALAENNAAARRCVNLDDSLGLKHDAPGRRARHRPLAERLVLDGRRRQGHERRRPPDQPVITGDGPGRQGDHGRPTTPSIVTLHHRPHERRRRPACSTPTATTACRGPEVGQPERAAHPDAADRGPRSRPATRWSPPARPSQTELPSLFPPNIPIGTRHPRRRPAS